MVQKTMKQLRKEVSNLKKIREKENERRELIKERREIKYGKTISAFKRFGSGIKGGARAIDKALVPQAYAKKKPILKKKRKVRYVTIRRRVRPKKRIKYEYVRQRK